MRRPLVMSRCRLLAIQKFSKTGDNAALAKQNGLRISGKDRKEFEDRLNGKRTSIQKMEDALRQ